MVGTIEGTGDDGRNTVVAGPMVGGAVAGPDVGGTRVGSPDTRGAPVVGPLNDVGFTPVRGIEGLADVAEGNTVGGKVGWGMDDGMGPVDEMVADEQAAARGDPLHLSLPQYSVTAAQHAELGGTLYTKMSQQAGDAHGDDAPVALKPTPMVHWPVELPEHEKKHVSADVNSRPPTGSVGIAMATHSSMRPKHEKFCMSPVKVSIDALHAALAPHAISDAPHATSHPFADLNQELGKQLVCQPHTPPAVRFAVEQSSRSTAW